MLTGIGSGAGRSGNCCIAIEDRHGRLDRHEGRQIDAIALGPLTIAEPLLFFSFERDNAITWPVRFRRIPSHFPTCGVSRAEIKTPTCRCRLRPNAIEGRAPSFASCKSAWRVTFYPPNVHRCGVTSMPEEFERKLAAILAADIAGYSALMEADEEATVRDLKAHQAVILPLIAKHGGHIIDTAGDGILAEYASIVNAVECAVAIQKVMAERNGSIPAERQMRYRVGVNLGDVMHDKQRVYGDGVNIAARLESIAEPGGVCISGEAFAHVHRKLQLRFVDIGEHQLKNITNPVRVYRIDTALQFRGAPQTRTTLSLPDKPSIAVLPFTNLSGNPDQEYFGDGIAEDILTDLAKLRWLFVIARNSSFTFRGKAVDVRVVSR